MNAAIKQIVLATVAVGTFSFAASAESLYRDLKSAVPDLTFTRKQAAQAFLKTVENAVNYQQCTGLKMTNSHALELFEKHLIAITNK